jgi:hypothetical protein
VSPQPSAEYCPEDVFRVYDFAFRFRTNHSDARRCLTSLYRQFLDADGSEAPVLAALERDHVSGFRWMLAEKAGASSELGGALWSLEASLCEAIICSQRRCLALHAAALFSGTSAALIAGRSGAGKSTLSMALARRGFAVASDDVTLLDPDTLQVSPIPRCFHLDEQSVALLTADGLRLPKPPAGSSFIVPSDLGVTATLPCCARVLFFVSGPREQRPQLIPVSQAEMAARLLQETGQGPLGDSETVGVLSRLAAGAFCYKLIPGPLAPTADAVAELIEKYNRRAAIS